MKCFMGNPCGNPNCMYGDCPYCSAFTPTFFGIKVPRWLGKILFKFEAWLFRPKNNKF